MKKIFSILLVVSLLTSMTIVASAASTTTLTTTVPAATYTLNIPANQSIEFGDINYDLGGVTVSNATGFAVGKNLDVTISYDAFSSETTTTQIPISLRGWYSKLDGSNSGAYLNIANGDIITFCGKTDGTVELPSYIKSGTSHEYWLDNIEVLAESEDWGKALAGDYTATITFSAEVVAE